MQQRKERNMNRHHGILNLLKLSSQRRIVESYQRQTSKGAQICKYCKDPESSY